MIAIRPHERTSDAPNLKGSVPMGLLGSVAQIRMAAGASIAPYRGVPDEMDKDELGRNAEHVCDCISIAWGDKYRIW
jgi:hypothetical protein